jgi:small conductance mechanosensitive channel
MTKDAEAAAQQIIELVTTYSLDVIGALAILIVGWIVAGWVGNKTRSALTRAKSVDDTLAPFLANIARYAILAFVLVAVLAKFGIQTASIIAVLGTIGLAVGLALQGTLSHFAAGVVLLILRPFKVGETIDAGGQVGTVQEIGLFATILRTPDGIFVYIPNGQLLNASIKNMSRNPTRRVDVIVGIGYEDDVVKGLAIAKQVLDAEPRALKDPAPETMVVGLGDNSVNINMRCWVDGGDYFPVLSALQQEIKQRYDAEGISIPYPQRDVHIIGQKAD